MVIKNTELTKQYWQENLNERAKFSLADHELVDPVTNRGHVVSVQEITVPEHLPSNIIMSEIIVSDPFVEADPIGYKIIKNHVENVIEPLGIEIGMDVAADRTEATSLDERNPLTKAWLSDDALQSLSIWRENVPTALALDYLTDPSPGKEITAPDGRIAVSTPETAAHWRFVADAIGIRTRKEAMSELTAGFLAERMKDNDATWLSLASGTAEPSLQAGIAAMDTANVRMKMVVTDHDGRALKLVNGKAEELGYNERGEVLTVRQNILADNLPEILEADTGISQYTIVENMGFEEYLPQDGDTMQAYKGQGLPQASEFTKTAFDMVAPGGMLVSGNMVLPRPQLGFVFGAVDWPIINARTEEDIIRVYQEAGIMDNPDARVTMHRVIEEHSGLHIYNIVTVEKLT